MKGFAFVKHIRDWLESQSLLPMLLTGLAIGIGSGAWALWGLGEWWGGAVCLVLAALAVALSWGAEPVLEVVVESSDNPSGSSDDVVSISMDDQYYPALYRAADSASTKAQFAYLLAVRLHILALIVGAGLTVNSIPSTVYSVVNACVLLLALAISILIATMRYEKAWYSTRAVAESVKTATWRFMMRADPFLDVDYVKQVKAVFMNLLSEILSSNNQLGDLLGGDDAAQEQITEQMTEVRRKSLEDRKSFYLQYRIDEQRRWYARKSTYNKKRSTQFFALLVVLQGSAVACVLLKIAWPHWTIWPTDVFVVGASAVVTWVQLKRFQELATSYALTAHEIGIIRGRLPESETDAEFSDFVRDAENAFSREHTQWIAKVEG